MADFLNSNVGTLVGLAIIIGGGVFVVWRFVTKRQ